MVLAVGTSVTKAVSFIPTMIINTAEESYTPPHLTPGLEHCDIFNWVSDSFFPTSF